MKLKFFLYRLFFLGLYLFSTNHITLSQNTFKFYNGSDFKASAADKEAAEYEAITQDFFALLSANGQVVSKEQNLALANIAFFQDDELEDYSFFINSDSQKTEICYKDLIGYQNGIYFLLCKMGYEFLGVSENWIEMPRNISLPTINQTFTPDIPFFSYFGTGGLGKFNAQKDLFDDYQRRNSLNNRTKIGHGYNDFYKLKKEEIDRYQRQGKIIFRDFKGPKKDINEDSKEALELIKSYFEKKYLSGQSLLTISPKDGTSNQGLNSKNKKINNTVSKYLWIGNEVAKYLNQKYPNNNIEFGYYAYGNGKGQLLPPNLDLEDNIIIQVIPYAFQSDYKNTLNETADVKAFKAWKNSFPNLTYATYDYWNITQWSASLPQTNFFEIVPKRISTWKENQLIGATIESTYTSAITNPHFWVASKSAKGFEEKTIEQLYDDYFKLAFKDASIEMRSFYKLLSNWKGETSVCTAKQFLEQAYSVTNDLNAKKRIVELTAYIHFIDLSYNASEINDASRNDVQRSLQLERWAKKMNSLGIIQTWGVYAYNYRKIKPYKYLKSPDKVTDYLSNQSYSELEPTILNSINLDCDASSFSEFTYNLQDFRAIKPSSFEIRPYNVVEEYYFTPSTSQRINIKIKEPTPTSTFEIKGDNGYYRSYQSDTDIIMNDLVEAGVSYQIKLGDRYDSKGISFNDDQLYFVKTSSQVNGYKLNTFYFYVPENLEVIEFEGTHNLKTKKTTDILFNETILSEKNILFTKGGNLAIFSVPTNTSNYDIRGKVVSIRSWRSNFRILNLNPLRSRQEFTTTK